MNLTEERKRIATEIIQHEREYDQSRKFARRFYLKKHLQHLIAIHKLFEQVEQDGAYLETLEAYLKQEQKFREQFPNGEMTMKQFVSYPEVIGWNAPKVPFLHEQEKWVERVVERWNHRHPNKISRDKFLIAE